MMSVLIGATAMVTLYSLWVRRDTWWSRWEIGVTLAIALETCGVALMSPWAAEALAPGVHHVIRVWNIQQLLGHLCLIVAVTANIYHVLRRLADFDQIGPLYRRQVSRPARIGAVAMVAAFIAADADYHPHGFSTGDGGLWLNVYWVVFCVLLMYLAGYATRILLLLHEDPRARETVELYTASSALALAALLVQLSTMWIPADLSTLVWLCMCASVAIFAYGSARSWQAKAAWFSTGRALKEPNPPQALS